MDVGNLVNVLLIEFKNCPPDFVGEQKLQYEYRPSRTGAADRLNSEHLSLDQRSLRNPTTLVQNPIFFSCPAGIPGPSLFNVSHLPKSGQL